MRIKIEHIQNPYNYGSCMMAVTLMTAIEKEFKGTEYWVDCFTEEDLLRLKKETKIDNIKSYNLVSKGNIINKIYNKISKKLLKAKIDKIENVIVIGGDDISEYYGIEYLKNILSNIKKESETKNIILLGQTMGPFTEGRDEIGRASCRERVYVLV